MLSSWHSSTNLSSIQIFHSDGKRPDSNSIVPWKCPFLQQNLSRVERSNARTRSNVGPSNDIHVSNRVKSPTSPQGGGGSHVTMIGALCVYGKVSEKRDLACIIKKHNKNALRLKCYNFRRVNAIVFLFSALHTTPFLYGKIHFGILNMLHASIAMSDTPRSSNPP